jgi:sugar/nucleoside kinase (ribokinase family)
MGEMLVEIMRPRADMDHAQTGEYRGPFPSGAPAIFIDAVARLGVPAGLIGGVGRDGFGRCLQDRLRRDGVDCRFVQESENLSTAVAFVMYRTDGSREFIFHIGGTAATCIPEPDLALIRSPGFFHVMGSSLSADGRFRDSILAALRSFVNAGAKISFDPNIRPELLRGSSLSQIIQPVMEHCSVLHPGVDELLMIAGKSEVSQAADKLFRNQALEAIALKRGGKGCTIFTRQGVFDLPSYKILPVDPVDPTGAGDCFDAAFLCGILQGKSWLDCGRMAVAAGTLNAAAFGPMEGLISPANLNQVMADGFYRSPA